MTIGWTGRVKPGEPVCIRLQIPKNRKFPYITRHVPGVTEIELNNLREELVLVLAHELRHAYQIERGLFAAMQGYWREVDAEKHAIKLLERYRKTLT
jgi:hypothetical protein